MATENARVNLYINKDQFEKAITQAKGKVTQLENELEKLTEGSKEFGKTKSEIDAYRKKIETMEGKLSGKVAPSMREMEQTVRKLSNELRNMPTNAPERAMKVKQLQQARAELGKVKGELGGVNRQWSSMKTIVGGIGLAGIFTAAIAGAKQLFSQMLQVRGEFEKYQAVLKNAFNGNDSEAVRSMEMIQKIAAETPFSVQELTESYVKLVNQGFKPTSEEIVKLGDLAATQGKQMDQLTEALIDAQVGEFERLKEFGVRASKNGDKVTFTFRGVKEQVDFTDESIRNYILSLGELNSVSGAMSGIAETQVGAISNLGDKWDNFLNTLGKGNSGVLKSAISMLGNIIDAANKLFSGPKVDSSLTAELRNVTTAMNSELRVLKEGNFTAEQRAKIIGDFNAKYSEYLPSLLSEESSLEQINKYQAELNKHMQTRILYTAYQDQLADLAKLELEHAQRMIDAEKTKVELENKRIENTDDLLASSGGLNMAEQAALGLSKMNLDQSDKTFEEFEQRRKDAEAAVELSAEKLGTSLEEMQKLFGLTTANETETVSSEIQKALDSITKELEKHRVDILEASLTAEARELALTERKYAELIRQAEAAGRDIADIEELKEQELAMIREKWDNAREEKKLEEHKRRIKQLEQYRDQLFQTNLEREAEEQERLQELRDEQLISEEDFQAKKAAIHKKYVDERQSEEQKAFREQLQVYSDYVNTFASMTGALTGLVNSLKESELATVKEVSQGKNESDEEYARRKEAVEQEKLEIAKKYAGIELLMKVSDIVAGTASAIIQGYAQLGVYGTVFAGIMAATGAVQAGIAIAEYNKVQGYSEGGYTGGGLFTDGSGHKVAGIVHDNEYVIPKKLLEQPDIAQVVHTIEQVRLGRANGFAEGGPTSPMPAPTSTASVSPSTADSSPVMIALLRDILSKLSEPALAVYDDVEARRIRRLLKDFDAVEQKTQQ